MTEQFVGIFSRYGVICMYEVLPYEIKTKEEAIHYCQTRFNNSDDMHKFETVGTLKYETNT